MHQWDNIRIFLAVCRETSLSGASRRLGVDHTTVGRRLAQLERHLGARLFTRTPDGLTLTSAGHAIQVVCGAMEDSALALERLAAGYDTRMAGTVRLTATEPFSQFITPLLARLHATHPELEVELLTDYRVLDISRQQADLAIRIPRPVDPRLVCRKLGDYGSALYASHHYLAKHPRPRRGAGLRGHDLIGYVGPLPSLGPPFMGESIEGARMVLRSNSTLAQVSAVAAGLGVAELPCYLADAEWELNRVWPDQPAKSVALWLVTHEDLRRVARIRLVSSSIVESFRRNAQLLRDGNYKRRATTARLVPVTFGKTPSRPSGLKRRAR